VFTRRARWCHLRVPTRPVEQVRSRIIADYHAANLARARQTVEALVRDGWHVGLVPYGYRARRVRVGTPGDRPRRRVTLVVEPRDAAVVQLMFQRRARTGLSIAALVHALNIRRRSQLPVDQATGAPRPWTAARVHAILTNPVYTGRAVWGRTRHGHPLPTVEWVVSAPGAHPALVDDVTFAQAAAIRLPGLHARNAA